MLCLDRPSQVLLAAARTYGCETDEVLRVAEAIAVLDQDAPNSPTTYLAEAIQYVASGGLDACADAEPRDQAHCYTIMRIDAVRTTLRGQQGGENDG